MNSGYTQVLHSEQVMQVSFLEGPTLLWGIQIMIDAEGPTMRCAFPSLCRTCGFQLSSPDGGTEGDKRVEAKGGKWTLTSLAPCLLQALPFSAPACIQVLRTTPSLHLWAKSSRHLDHPIIYSL